MTSHPLESLPIPNANNPLIRRQIILLMAPLFKLMQACEKALNKGSLQEIDAMIGAGLIMFEKDYLSVSVYFYFKTKSMEKEREEIKNRTQILGLS